jgi:molybdopterin synthase sulfur carrier subunit
MTRVVLPYHLRSLAKVDGEVQVDAQTIAEVLDGLERAHPVLRGTLRDIGTGTRRPFVRFFACREDLSHTSYDEPLPAEVLDGREPFLVIGAMAGG